MNFGFILFFSHSELFLVIFNNYRKKITFKYTIVYEFWIYFIFFTFKIIFSNIQQILLSFFCGE